MGLSKFLAVSRSVRSSKDQPARYKMTQQNLLPTFGGAKASETRALEADPAVAEAMPKPVALELATLPAVAETAVAETADAARTKPGSDRAAEFLEATKKLCPFDDGSWFKKLFARTTPRRNENGPVQTELSLDSVKPVRNDLSDSEVELGRLPGRAGVAPGIPSAPKAPPDQAPAAAGGLWQRLKTRLFGGSGKN